MSTTKVLPILDSAEIISTSKLYDCVVVLFESLASEALRKLPIYGALEKYAELDASVGKKVTFLVEPSIAGSRLILSPTGRLDGDGDDVRRYAEAASAGVSRAIAAGALAPALVIVEGSVIYSEFVSVAVLGALQAGYEMLQAREFGVAEKLKRIGFVCHGQGLQPQDALRTADVLEAIEAGRRVSRDIGTADPERMTPTNAAAYISGLFKGTDVCVEVIDDPQGLAQYPCAMAVARASLRVQRHAPRIVRLTYAPATATRTLLMAGKGIVYDTGGADVKTGGHMAGMSRDKGGAASLAGFMRVISILKPAHLAVRMELGFVRNSIGADSYVADEIITTRAGVRVQVVNTDAEGRMVLCELLASLREYADEKKPAHPVFMTCATLTGHAGLAVGPYSVALDNRVAQEQGLARQLQAAGEDWGDCFEVSTLRREDVEYVEPKNSCFDVLQCGTLPSSQTRRGHQFPAAFLLRASGLDKTKYAFTHMDIAGSFTDNYTFGKGTGSPVTALVARFALQQEKFD